MDEKTWKLVLFNFSTSERCIDAYETFMVKATRLKTGIRNMWIYLFYATSRLPRLLIFGMLAGTDYEYSYSLQPRLS